MNQVIFDLYVRWYNWVARKTDGTFLREWHSNTFIDFKVWHKRSPAACSRLSWDCSACPSWRYGMSSEAAMTNRQIIKMMGGYFLKAIAIYGCSWAFYYYVFFPFVKHLTE